MKRSAYKMQNILNVKAGDTYNSHGTLKDFFFFGATAPIWALAYLHETLRFTSVY
jgi:hypothetical protein